MKSLKISSVILFLAIVVLACFIGGKQINKTIEETIHNNYASEIEALKTKLNKQSELLNSLIDLNNKEDSDNKDIENDENDSSSVDTNTDNTTTDTPAEFQYVKENGGIIITKYLGKQTTVRVPDKIDNLPVIKIGENAFADCKVKSVTLPSSCQEIDWFAFYGCFALSSIYVSDTVTTIGYGAFDACSKNLTIYCAKSSYAEEYAQSFGIKYSYFQ